MFFSGEDIKYINSKNLSDVIHGITNKTTDFAHINPDSEDFIKSKEKLAKEFNIKEENLFFLKQVHGTEIVNISEQSENILYEADALITNEKNKLLAVCTADCVPVLLFDKEKNAIGAIHAGWKGTLKRIVTKTINRMQTEFNTEPKDIMAYIGPSIGKCCFNVSEDVALSFADEFGDSVVTDKQTVDLWQVNKLQLLNEGVLEENIEVSGICTVCNTKDFYSYRAGDIDKGRFASFIML